MSYARMSDGDVYVFINTNGYLECCGCRFGESLWTKSVDELEAHLKRHVEAGHDVELDRIMSEVRADFPSGTTEKPGEFVQEVQQAPVPPEEPEPHGRRRRR